MASNVTYEYIRRNPDVLEYVRRADKVLEAIGYTEHSFAHVEKVSYVSSMILEELGYPDRIVELARIAGFMHDIGNIVNRADHAHNGAIMAFCLLEKLHMPADEICSIISAIGNHDERTAQPVDPISAALILADKTDVRRSRVRNTTFISFDIHDRVNYAVTSSKLTVSKDKKSFNLELDIDTEISSVLEYFEIFMDRMLLCKRAAQYFDMSFRIYMNDSIVL
ncbi:MAG: HD domain-containing protein [Ruminococcus sp.]|nr:HD domain-containing protein [Ruminococcus sp.]